MRLPVLSRRQICRLCLLAGQESRLRVHFPRAPKWRSYKRVGVLAATQPLLRLVAGAVAVLLLGFSLPAWASLGGDVSSVEADGARMNASRQVMQHGAYSVHEIQEPGGTVVDEYVSQGGLVFAISWRGQFPPQMQQILGIYFQQYAAALKAQWSQGQPRTGRRPLDIQLPGLVVQTGGPARAQYGRAYIPDQLPTDIDVNQIH